MNHPPTACYNHCHSIPSAIVITSIMASLTSTMAITSVMTFASTTATTSTMASLVLQHHYCNGHY